MAAVYQTAPKEVEALLKAVRAQYYRDLDETGVTICVLMAVAKAKETPDGEIVGEAMDPALKLHGHEAAAVISITSHKNRVAGQDDALLCIDAKKWEDMDDSQRRALLDGQLQRIQVRVDDDGNPLTDDCSRPKLALRPFDYVLRGYEAVAKRHGENSQEVIEAKAWAKDGAGQMLMWG